jgi:hypothetical protein
LQEKRSKRARKDKVRNDIPEEPGKNPKNMRPIISRPEAKRAEGTPLYMGRVELNAKPGLE